MGATLHQTRPYFTSTREETNNEKYSCSQCGIFLQQTLVFFRNLNWGFALAVLLSNIVETEVLEPRCHFIQKGVVKNIKALLEKIARNVLHTISVERFLYTVNHLCCTQFHNLDGDKQLCNKKGFR